MSMEKGEIKTDIQSSDAGRILLYQAQNGKIQVEVSLKDETIWLDAHQMAELFQRDRTVIVRHIHNIPNTGQ